MVQAPRFCESCAKTRTKRPDWKSLALLAGVALTASFAPAAAPAAPAAPESRTVPSRVTSVTVYQATALVTREVTVPAGTGSMELLVSPLPPQVVMTSLYSEGSDGIRVLATRSRTQAVQEDTRAEVRKREARAKELQLRSQQLQEAIKTAEQNLQMLSKLESFTAATMQQLTEKGLLSDKTTIALADYIMETRVEKSKEMVDLQQQSQANQEQAAFVQRQLQELAANSTKTETGAVIVVDKKNAAAGKVRLNYLVQSASWHPQYKFRAGKEQDPVQVEYLAAVTQKTGEDWSRVRLVLSTAQPLLNAAPPDLKVLDVAVAPGGTINPVLGVPVFNGGQGGLAQGNTASGGLATNPGELTIQSKALRGQAAQEYRFNRAKTGGEFLNTAAALEQTQDLLASREEQFKVGKKPAPNPSGEGPTVTHHLATRLTIPSRNDEQIVEVARVELKPDYFYKAVPVLTSQVYRLANFINETDYVLLPGEATMYIGTDFVGRARLPLVAIGEQFTAGFGVDPQVQVQRQLVEKSRATQGGNQVLKYQYRILASSYRSEAVKLQVWDRLPHAETQAVAVTLVNPQPGISDDPVYLREDRPKNLLRWDLSLEPKRHGEKALAIQYEFKLELDRQMHIAMVTAK